MTFTSDFTIGSVLVWKDYHQTLAGHKVVDYVWHNVDGVSTKLWILRRGSVKDNQFEFNSENDNKFIIKTTDQVRAYGFEKVWTPEEGFKDGDFLVDSSGRVFYHENKNAVWRLSTTTGNSELVAHASLKSRVGQYGKLHVLRTASMRPFREVVK